MGRLVSEPGGFLVSCAGPLPVGRLVGAVPVEGFVDDLLHGDAAVECLSAEPFVAVFREADRQCVPFVYHDATLPLSGRGCLRFGPPSCDVLPGRVERPSQQFGSAVVVGGHPVRELERPRPYAGAGGAGQYASPGGAVGWQVLLGIEL